MSAQPKVPRKPPASLRIDPVHLVHVAEPLWRIHNAAGPHRLAWNELRRFGPLESFRWEPHPPPTTTHPTTGVLYAAFDVLTVFGEVFQHRRRIQLDGNRALVGWSPVRELRLLDLTGLWPVHNGASAALQSAPRSTCRAWAQAIHAFRPDLDGVYALSTVTNRPMAALFTSAASAFPPAPSLSRRLDDPALASTVDNASQALRWPLST